MLTWTLFGTIFFHSDGKQTSVLVYTHWPKSLPYTVVRRENQGRKMLVGHKPIWDLLLLWSTKRVWERPGIKLEKAGLTEYSWIIESWHGRAWARPCWSQSGAPNWKPEYQTAGTDGANETRWYWGESCVLTLNWVSDGSTESSSLQNMLITDILFICASWPNPWQGNNIRIISTALHQSIPNWVWREEESTFCLISPVIF